MTGKATIPGAASAFEQFLEFVPDAIVGVGEGGTIVLLNTQTEGLFGYRRDELVGQPVELLVPELFKDIHPDHRARYFADLRTRPTGAETAVQGIRKDGSEFPAEIGLSSIETEQGTLATAAIRDIGERAERERALAEELDRGRRLESVGQLAGGIAHDFNNMLGVILNYAELVAEGLEPGSQSREDVDEIHAAAERAAALTRQLLIFSRRKAVQPEVMDLTELASELDNLLRRALGERIVLETRFQKDLWPVEADPGQLEQVIINLAFNARDAMPDGGQLVIEGANTELDEEFAAVHADVAAGSYVQLMVSDTGVGMTRDVQDRAFEPFFTTKNKAHGTGLGLATAHGIVTAAGGRIELYSEPGVGTTVKIHLPVSISSPAANTPSAPGPRGSGEVVLVVEDEDSVRRMAERILSKAGYAVIGARGGEDALRICGQSEQPIDLLLTDVIMPGVLGTELADRVRDLRIGLKVIFMSGYSHDVLEPEALSKSGAAFIEKPFSARKLLTLVHEHLDGSTNPGDDGKTTLR